MILGMFNYHSKSRSLVGRNRGSSNSSKPINEDEDNEWITKEIEKVKKLNKNRDNSGLDIVYG